MSDNDLRIALVAEGTTDLIVIEAALNAILDQPFILTQLQPEPTRPDLGGGWGGVLKWSMETAKRVSGCLDDDPTLSGFDLLIIHLDVDVAGFRYSNLGAPGAELGSHSNMVALPCKQPCPPVSDSVNALQRVLLSWLSPATNGNRTILCLPAQSSGTWLAAALLPESHPLLVGAECNPAVEDGLAQLPKTVRIRKNQREYRAQADAITHQWGRVKIICSQALVFENSVRSKI
jgi:hypothetical protein